MVGGKRGIVAEREENKTWGNRGSEKAKERSTFERTQRCSLVEVRKHCLCD